MAADTCAKRTPLTTARPKAKQARRVYTRQEAESWQLENNQYIMGHYRTVSYSYQACIASLGYLHNQSSNVYSHLLAMVMFAFWATQLYGDLLQRYATSNLGDVAIFAVFFASTLFCFGSSASFHLFANHSAEVNHAWLLFDLYGVFAMITATIISGTYYGFYCEPIWFRVYTGGIVIITSLCAAFCTLPRYRHGGWRNVRAVLFVSIGFYGCIPMNHGAHRYGWPKVNEMIGWNLMYWEGLSYFLGALLYGIRVPERWSPGTFDVFGSSHQLFHVCAVIGAALHYQGLLVGFDYTHNPATRQC